MEIEQKGKTLLFLFFILFMFKILMGERRELNPRMMDSQSTALIHLATSAPYSLQNYQKKECNSYH